MNLSTKIHVENDASRAGATVSVWELQPGESVRWFARFNSFRLLGSGRSIDAAWRQELREKTNKNGRAPDSWHKASKRFNWRERALAWDIADSQQLWQQVVAERDRRLKLTLEERQRRERLLVGLDRTFRFHVARLSSKNKLDAERYARSIDWSEARLKAHFDFVERMIRLSHGEYAAEERLLAEMAVFQPHCIETREVSIQQDAALNGKRHGHIERSQTPLLGSDSMSDSDLQDSVCAASLSARPVEADTKVTNGSRSRRTRKAKG